MLWLFLLAFSPQNRTGLPHLTYTPPLREQKKDQLGLHIAPSPPKLSLKVALPIRFSSIYVFSFAFLLIVLLVQSLRSGSQLLLPSWTESKHDHIIDQRQRENKPIFVDEPASTMSLHEEAQRIAAEFEYPADAVNRGVQEFIRQMSASIARRSA